MDKFHEKTGLQPLGELPYLLRAFIVFGLFAGVASIAGLILGNDVGIALIALLWGAVSVIVWYFASNPERRSANQQKPAKSRTGTTTATAQPATTATAPTRTRRTYSSQKGVVGEPPFCPSLMTGQLVARYKKTHDEQYQNEYLRRLRSIGFDEQQANLMFMYELMTLKHFAIDELCSDDYLRSSVFNLREPVLKQDDSYYVEHQSFLCSQIVKIWDEAEWHYFNSHEHKDLSEEAWSEIHRISRYGGGKLFLDYLESMAEHSSVPFDKVQRYSAAEQQMLFAYKWNADKGEHHPYPV